MRTRPRLIAVAALAAALPLTGCSSSSDEHANHAVTGSSNSAPAATTTAPAGSPASVLPTVAPGAEQFEIYVGPATVPCTGVAPMECLRVRRDPNAAWENHYSGIEGFDFEPGYTYHLLIEQRPRADPPADAPSATWHLVSVLSKTPA
ncbi:DUF4377 domain-containing protein [Nocardia sp. NPDC005978]|uniref:DUF4377 domain-containing protein n=1 Tax=unclassified Nocardia TaxID=2637762 RepID=UPI0033A8A5C3